MGGKGPMTLCGSLSLHPVPLGMRMHNAGYRALGLDFTYVPFGLESSGLEDALRGMRALGIRGFGISMPFKIEIMPLLDAVDPLAEQIGAVNTVVNDDGKLTGHNTDAWGAARALEEAIALRGKRAVVLGAGGAARAVAYSLASEGMALHLANRNGDRAKALATEIRGNVVNARVTAGSIAELSSLADYDTLVNASSAGMDGYGGSPLSPDLLYEGLAVMDIVYKPIRTELVRDAEARSARTVHGGRMLLHQARRQFELYTGKPAPLDAMNDALEAAIG